MKTHRLTKTQQHAYAVKAILLKYYGKEFLSKISYQLYKEISKISGLDFDLQHFFVLKEADGLGHQRGDIVFSCPSCKYRNITTYKKPTRQALKGIARLLDLPIPHQHGFTAHHGISDIVVKLSPSSKRKSLCKIDLISSFEQVSSQMVYDLLRIVFDLNKTTAKTFTEQMTYKGKLFQGNPISPLLFNLATSRYCEILNRCNIDFEQYADDLIVFSEYDYFSKHQMQFIINIIKQCNFETNPDKCKRLHTRRCNALGVVASYGLLDIGKKRRTKNKLRLFLYLLNKGIEYSHRTSKDGKHIKIEFLIMGYLNWLTFPLIWNTYTHNWKIPSEYSQRYDKFVAQRLDNIAQFSA